MQKQVLVVFLVWLGLFGSCNPKINSSEKMVNLDLLQRESGLGIDELNLAIGKEPREAGFYKLRSRLYLDQKEYELALKDVEVAIRLKPDQGELYFIQARAQRALDQTAQALASAQQALARQYANTDLYVLLGEIKVSLNQNQEAIQYLNEALQLFPENGYASFYKGKALAATGDTVRALEQLQKGVREEPFLTAGYIALARLHYARHDYVSARQFAHKALSQEPHNAQLWHFFGLTYEGLSRPDSAIICYRKAGNLDPDLQTPMVMQIARLAYSRKEFNQAIQILLPLLEGNPDFDSGRFLLAECYERTGQWREALTHYGFLKDNKPDHQQAYVSYWQLHQRHQALRPTQAPIQLLEKKNTRLSN
jgi:tetratricopeptide (TPR) repeat protein